MSHVKLISKTCDRYILQFFSGLPAGVGLDPVWEV